MNNNNKLIQTNTYERDSVTKEPIVPIAKGLSESMDKFKAISDAIEKSTPEIDKMLKDITSDNNKEVEMEYISPEDVSTDNITVVTNPNTGICAPLPAKYDNIDKEMARLLNINPAELYSIPDSVDDIEIPDEFYINNFKDSDFDIEDTDVTYLVSLIKEYRKNSNQNWYEKLPINMVKQINKMCMEIGNSDLSYRKFIANSFMQQIVATSGMDKVIIDMQKSLSEAYNVDDIMKIALDLTQTSMENEIDIRIKTVDELEEKIKLDIENGVGTDEVITKDGIMVNKLEYELSICAKQRENFMKQKYSISQSYQFSSLIDDLEKGKIKVKKKHTDKYGRFCKEFLFKYQNDTPFVIDDITICVPILIKKLTMFTSEQIANFVIAFCMQVKNFNSRDAYDHTYMYYVIHNIKTLNFVSNQEHNNFSKELLYNIYRCVSLVNNLNEDYDKNEFFASLELNECVEED